MCLKTAVLFAIVCLSFFQYIEAAGIVHCTTRPNEEYQCGSACQTTCKNLGEVCPIVNKRCNLTCYCIKGYARDDSGTCIPISQCPPKQTHD